MTAQNKNPDIRPQGEAAPRSEEQSYAEFVRLMNEEGLYTDRCITFEAVCRLLGQDVGSLDGIIVLELGMTGRQVMDTLRRRWLAVRHPGDPPAAEPAAGSWL